MYRYCLSVQPYLVLLERSVHVVSLNLFNLKFISIICADAHRQKHAHAQVELHCTGLEHVSKLCSRCQAGAKTIVCCCQYCYVLSAVNASLAILQLVLKLVRSQQYRFRTCSMHSFAPTRQLTLGVGTTMDCKRRQGCGAALIWRLRLFSYAGGSGSGQKAAPGRLRLHLNLRCFQLK